MNIDNSRHILNHSDYKKITEFIKVKYDFDLSDYAYSITKRRLETFFAQYNANTADLMISFLEKDKFWNIFKEVFFVPTTELFRDFDVWYKLKSKYLSKLNNFPNIKIWFPDVTSDDELYSFLIVLNEMNVKDYQIVITSQFEEIEEKVFNYKLSKKKFDSSKQNYTNYNPDRDICDFLVNTKLNYGFSKDCLDNVVFRKFSLLKDEVENDEFDLIIFRNRMLYYNIRSQEQILNKIYNSQKNKGLLMLGLKETLNRWNLSDKYSEASRELGLYIKKR